MAKISELKIARKPDRDRVFPTVDDRPEAPVSVAEAVVKMLEDLGVEYAFGVSGGAIAPILSALTKSKKIQVVQFCHEAGAAFAAAEAYFASQKAGAAFTAAEAYFASQKPVAVFTTTGPGITNALTGLWTARWEGAKIIQISAYTPALHQGKKAFQETSEYTMADTGLFTTSLLFHYARILNSADLLPEVAERLARGFRQLGGFVAHLSIPKDIQIKESVALPEIDRVWDSEIFLASNSDIAESAMLLASGKFAIWVGFGARQSGAEIRALAERTGAAVMCSPRGKGIFPENHPQFVGVTGFGGHDSVLTYMQKFRPERLLVLGTSLGEFTSFWNPALIPLQGLIHVDIDPEVSGMAYPSARTLFVQSDVKAFVVGLLRHFLKRQIPLETESPFPQATTVKARKGKGRVRSQVLMDAIQKVVVKKKSQTIAIAETDNSFAWTTHCLCFTTPNYRVSTGFAAMGHAASGVLGAALVRDKAVAIVSNAAMLMNCGEVSTAVQYKIPAVWIVLNDGGHKITDRGKNAENLLPVEGKIPQTNFKAIARNMGAKGIRVKKEHQLKVALKKAITSGKPFVIDVVVERSEVPPISNASYQLSR